MDIKKLRIERMKEIVQEMRGLLNEFEGHLEEMGYPGALNRAKISWLKVMREYLNEAVSPDKLTVGFTIKESEAGLVQDKKNDEYT